MKQCGRAGVTEECLLTCRRESIVARANAGAVTDRDVAYLSITMCPSNGDRGLYSLRNVMF